MKTIYQANRELANIFNGTATTFPSTVYIGFSTSATITEAGFTEPTASSYARIPVVVNTTNFTVPSNGSVLLKTEIVSAELEADIGTVYAFGIYDALTSGHLMYYDDLTASKIVQAGTALKFKANSITITES